MPDGDPLKEAIRAIIQQELANLQSNTPAASASQLKGVVAAINDDGTVNVNTAGGILSSVSTPVRRVIGDQVVVVTSVEGAQVAV